MRKPYAHIAVDVLICTPVTVEYTAVAPLLRDAVYHEVSSAGRGFLLGRVSTPQGKLSVALMRTGKGVSETHGGVGAALRMLQPRIAILFGMAGGLKKTTIGDIIIGTHGRNYERGRVTDDGFRSNSESLPCSRRLVDRAINLGRDTTAWYPLLPADELVEPQVYDGPIVSGDKVIDTTTDRLLRVLRNHHSEAVGLEMEAYAFLAAVTAQPGPEAIIIRGVSDLLKDKESVNANGSKAFALGRAVAFLHGFLRTLTPVQEPKRDHLRLAYVLGVLLLGCAVVAALRLVSPPAPASAPALSSFRIAVSASALPDDTAVTVVDTTLLPPPLPIPESKPKASKTDEATPTPTADRIDSIAGSLDPLISQNDEQRADTLLTPKMSSPAVSLVTYPYEFMIYQAPGRKINFHACLIDGQPVTWHNGVVQLPPGPHKLSFTLNTTPYVIPFTVDPMEQNSNNMYLELY